MGLNDIISYHYLPSVMGRRLVCIFILILGEKALPNLPSPVLWQQMWGPLFQDGLDKSLKFRGWEIHIA